MFAPGEWAGDSGDDGGERGLQTEWERLLSRLGSPDETILDLMAALRFASMSAARYMHPRERALLVSATLALVGGGQASTQQLVVILYLFVCHPVLVGGGVGDNVGRDIWHACASSLEQHAQLGLLFNERGAEPL